MYCADAQNIIELGDVTIDTAGGTVRKEGQELFLSALEYRLLLVFANHKGNVLSRNQLLEEIWDVAGEFVNDNTLTVYIKRLREKIETVVRDIYGGDGVELLPAAARELERLHALGFGGLPVCIAKTQYSLSDNPALLGRPEHFRVTVKQVRLSAGAGFVVVLTGDIMTMPGLPKVPAAETIDVDDDGRIHGLF